eukprot:scaffold478_cov409-Prasinococcus_capsulatus_cf.AAC.12
MCLELATGGCRVSFVLRAQPNSRTVLSVRKAIGTDVCYLFLSAVVQDAAPGSKLLFGALFRRSCACPYKYVEIPPLTSGARPVLSTHPSYAI